MLRRAAFPSVGLGLCLCFLGQLDTFTDPQGLSAGSPGPDRTQPPRVSCADIGQCHGDVAEGPVPAWSLPQGAHLKSLVTYGPC